MNSCKFTGAYNFSVTGSIDGKFEYGYLVTVNIGSETLHGVLYHVQHPPPTVAATAASSAAAAVATSFDGSAATNNGNPMRSRRRRKRGWRHRDPAHPKPNRSAYNFFFAEKHSKLKSLFPNREREFSKMIGESWNKLTEQERMVSPLQNRRFLTVLNFFLLNMFSSFNLNIVF